MQALSASTHFWCTGLRLHRTYALRLVPAPPLEVVAFDNSLLTVK